MDITLILNELIKIIFSAAGCMVVYGLKQYAMPWLQSKLTANQLANMKSILVVLIKAAQQMEANGAFDEVADTNTAKREYVIKQAKVEFEKVGLTFDEQTIETTLEGLLKDAKNSITIE
jgi:dihydroxyacetone kinase-like predicted kinase